MIFPRATILPPAMPPRHTRFAPDMGTTSALLLFFVTGIAAWAGIIYTAWWLWHLLGWSTP